MNKASKKLVARKNIKIKKSSSNLKLRNLEIETRPKLPFTSTFKNMNFGYDENLENTAELKQHKHEVGGRRDFSSTYSKTSIPSLQTPNPKKTAVEYRPNYQHFPVIGDGSGFKTMNRQTDNKEFKFPTFNFKQLINESNNEDKSKGSGEGSSKLNDSGTKIIPVAGSKNTKSKLPKVYKQVHTRGAVSDKKSSEGKSNRLSMGPLIDNKTMLSEAGKPRKQARRAQSKSKKRPKSKQMVLLKSIKKKLSMRGLLNQDPSDSSGRSKSSLET